MSDLDYYSLKKVIKVLSIFLKKNVSMSHLIKER